MANYKLSEDAEADLIRIHQYGVKVHGEAQADAYYNAFFDHFEQIAEHPLIYPAVNYIRESYRRSVCGVDSVYYRIEDKIVEIMAIIRQQDTNKWL